MAVTPINEAALKRQHLLAQVVTGVAATNAPYSALFKTNVKTHPLLYWGNPISARFATFGVNPSAGEFSARRRWPNSMTVTELDDRLVNYFISSHRSLSPMV